MTHATWPAATLLLIAFLLAYLPDLGHGFVSDDFTWMVAARSFLEQPSLDALTSTTNFLRPLVTLSFAANLWLFDLSARAYGLTNLALVLACAVLIYRLCRMLSLASSAALVGAAAWAFNFHGINMAILWISGRTSLLLTLFALLTAWCVLSNRAGLAAIFCAAALFSKEEAVAVPVVMVLWAGIRRAWPLALPLALYFSVRLQTSAFWPQEAPDYYRFTTDPAALAVNALHYLDRGGTVFALVAVVLLISLRRTPHLSEVHRSVLVRGATWFIGGYALTVWVPVRSSLYAVFPSVGAAVVLATVADAWFASADAVRMRRAAVALLALPFLLWPVYRARNERWVELAALTRVIVPQMQPLVAAMASGAPVWIEDDDTTRANVRNAFGGQMENAMRLHYRVAPQIHVGTAKELDAPAGVPVLVLRNGRLQHR